MRKRIERIRRAFAMSWEEWAYQEFLRYMYIFVCIFVNISVLDQIKRTLGNFEIVYIVFIGLVTLIIMIILEYKLYRKIWKKASE